MIPGIGHNLVRTLSYLIFVVDESKDLPGEVSLFVAPHSWVKDAAVKVQSTAIKRPNKHKLLSQIPQSRFLEKMAGFIPVTLN